MGTAVTDLGLENKLERRELKKHAATIHCSNSLSLLQRKISNALLYHAYKELMTKDEHEITVKQLCRLISYSGNNHAVIKDALKGLISTVIEWNIVNDTTGKEDWTASSIIASVSLQGPVCLYAYSPRMKQLLHSPSMFGKINLVIQSQFKSSYGLALYENCIRYCGLPYTKWLDLVTFRKLMGVPEDTYPIFRDFKKRVLDKSVEEVNTYSDLIIEPELFREGRQVSRIRFSLKEREKKTRLGITTVKQEDSIDKQEADLKNKLLLHYGFSLEQAERLLHEYPDDFINEKMSVVESSRNYQQGKVQNLAGYLLSALKNNFQLAKTSHEAVRSSQSDPAKEIVSLQRRVERIREEYHVYREEAIDAAIAKLTETVWEQLVSQFKTEAAYSIATVLKVQRSKYTEETILQSPQIKALLRTFVLERMPEVKASLISLNEYVEGLPKEKVTLWEQFRELVPENDIT